MLNRVMALLGAYGSGKTELSINFAIDSQRDKNKEYERTVLCDLDIVNPYFRSSEKSDILIKENVEIIKPMFAGTNVDSPMLSPKVGGYFIYKDIYYLLDVGGDPVGARAIGQHRHKFKENDGKMYYVVNTFRPFTKDVEDILEMIAKIQESAGMNFHGIIHNSNLGALTTYEHLVHGTDIVTKVADKSGIPVVLTCGMENVINDFVQKENYKGETYIMKRFMELGF